MTTKKDTFGGFSEDDELISGEETNNNNADTEAAVKTKTDAEVAVETAKNKEITKTDDEIADEIKSKEEVDKSTTGKTAEQLATEKKALEEEAKKYEGKTLEEIEKMKRDELKISDELVLDDEKPNDEKDKNVKSLDYLTLAKKHELTIDEGIDSLTEEEYHEKLAEKIEGSKQKFTYQGIPDDTKDIVKFFAEDGGTVSDLLSDHELIAVEVYKSMSDNDKVLRYQTDVYTRAGMDDETAVEEAEKFVGSMSEKDIAQAVIRINGELDVYKKRTIERVVGERKKVVEAEKTKSLAKAQAEKKVMISMVKAMEDFAGMKLTPELREKLVARIESGDLDKQLNVSAAEARINAYMHKLFGKQIKANLHTALVKEGREGYNKATDKFIQIAHNEAPDKREKSQHQSQSAKGWDKLANIEDI